MTKVMTITVTGVKCDNEDCDYRDDEVNQENYSEYINKPCPKCDSVLLTQEDYDAVIALESMAALEIDIPEDLLGEEEFYDVNMSEAGMVRLVKREEE